MSNPARPQSSRFGKQRSASLPKHTFFDRHYRGIHHATVLLGLSIFFGPFVYKYLTRPPLEELDKHFRPNSGPRVDYAKVQQELNDKWN